MMDINRCGIDGLTKLDENKIKLCLIQCVTDVLVWEWTLWCGTNIVSLIVASAPNP